MKRTLVFSTVLTMIAAAILAVMAHAEETPHPKSLDPIGDLYPEEDIPRWRKLDYDMLEPGAHDPEKDADIDMYICDWREGASSTTHGCLLERTIFTHGDPKHPARKGSVLKYVNRFVYATLYSHNMTEPYTPVDEQEIFYFTGGTGELRSADTTFAVGDGIFVLVPPGVEFTMTNTGDEPLTMYIIAEPITRDDFTPHDDIKMVDINSNPIVSPNGHWAMVIKNAFNLSRDLCIIEYINIITFDPMTIGQPHAHIEGCEEVWTMVEGPETPFLLGKQLRMQKPGVAYYCPPYSNCTHANINTSDKPFKLLYFAVRDDWTGMDNIKRTK